MVARELNTGRLLRVWRDELYQMTAPPFPIDQSSLFVAYNASAEFSCFLVLGWDMPARVLDLYVERLRTVNGRGLADKGRSLVATLRAYGLEAIDADEKQEMRNLAMRAGNHYAQAEREALLTYCQSDVDALRDLLPVMLPDILDGPAGPDRTLGQALLRGRYMVAVARMVHHGIPIDTIMLNKIYDNWDSIKLALIEKVDSHYGTYEGAAFKRDRFAAYLANEGIPWPRHSTGSLDLSEDVFRKMTRVYPQLAPLHELRQYMGKLKIRTFTVGADGRNRAALWPFKSVTGRNQPRSSQFIFGASRWMRSLIKPPPGYGLIYADFANQEIGIAAALSRDPGLMAGYKAGDPYMDFGIRSGVLPEGATKHSHADTRQLLKGTVLGINYGMQERTLASRLDVTPFEARQLIQKHREAYPVFWEWSDAVCAQGMLTLQLSTELGWTQTLDCRSKINPRALINFPMQANGAEILRLACCLATEDGLEIVAPVHDALAMVAPLDAIDDHTARLLQHMEAASETVLSGFTIRAEVEAEVLHPNRYSDKGGHEMWDLVTGLLPEAAEVEV